MFGYIYPLKPEMKIKDYERFRAYYCGVCHSISNLAGQAARFVLSYDSAFFAVFLDGIHNDKDIVFKLSKCLRHPIRKRLSCYNSICLDYAADVNTILTWYNIQDKYLDGDCLKSLPALAVLKNAFNKSRSRYPVLSSSIKDELDALHAYEKELCNNIDLICEPFANIIKIIACPEFMNLSPSSKESLQWLGYNLGKWLYLIDAYDDLKQDIEKNNYNPLIYRYEFDADKQNPDDFKKSIKDNVEFILLNCLDQIAKAYEVIDIYKNAGIIENIIYMGMLNKTDKVLQGVDDNEKSV